MLKKLFQSISAPLRHLPPRRTHQVIPASQHPIRPDDISRHACSVVERLQKAGYEAYVVGGCVRDLLLDVEPKDYDVATEATPEQIRALFRNARIIGRRFRLVHVHFGREIIEVATFRADHSQDSHAPRHSQHSASGQILKDNVFGSLQEDARRRDFTVNAIYYDPCSGRIQDHAHGLHDIRNEQIRLIGTPVQRYKEDPVRMLRAVRFAAKLDFEIEQHTAAPIDELGYLLEGIPAARLFDEVLKLFLSGHGEHSFDLLLDFGLFEHLFPATADALQQSPDYTETLIRQALVNTDDRLAEGKSVTPAFLFAALLWPALPARSLELQDEGLPPIPAMQEAAQDIIWEQCQRTAIPKRFSMVIKEIWDLQERLPRRHGKRADELLERPRFRAGYDFLLLREGAGEETQGLGEWWTQYQEADPRTRRQMIQGLGEKSGPAPRKRRSRRKRPPTA